MGQGSATRIPEDSLYFRSVERFGEQIVSPQIQGFGPEARVGVSIRDYYFDIAGELACKVQYVQPITVGESGFGEQHVVVLLLKLSARVPDSFHMIEFHGKGSEHLRESAGIVAMSGNE